MYTQIIEAMAKEITRSLSNDATDWRLHLKEAEAAYDGLMLFVFSIMVNDMDATDNV